MSEVLGGFKLGGELGGIKIVNTDCRKLPQRAASAMGMINEKAMFGATYDPLWYIGEQLVNGTNYMFVCRQVKSTRNANTSICIVVINVPTDGSNKEPTIFRVIEEADMSQELHCLFRTATFNCGIGYKPLIHIGSQVVAGENNFFIAEANIMYPGSIPYPVLIQIRTFMGVNIVEKIKKLGVSDEEEKVNGIACPLGEWP